MQFSLRTLFFTLLAGVLGGAVAAVLLVKVETKPQNGDRDNYDRGIHIHFGDQAQTPGAIINAGWVDSPAEVKAVSDRQPFGSFGDTPAGKAVTGDEDAFLWKAHEDLFGRPMEARDQKDVGSCVSFGTAAAVDVLQCLLIADAKRKGKVAAEYRPACQEAIYGGARVEVGGGRIRGDGAVGAWAADWCEHYGIVWRGKILSYDLTTYSTSLCRQWGRSGVPADLEKVAREYPVGGVVKIKNADEAARALRQGVTIAVCSNQGFTSKRDSEGFARPSGSWAHCMSAIGVKGGRRPGFFIWNSWGPNWISGPKGPGNPPEGGFWCDWDTFDRMCRYGDTWGFGAFSGFPAKKLDWFAKVHQNDRRTVADVEYALAP